MMTTVSPAAFPPMLSHAHTQLPLPPQAEAAAAREAQSSLTQQARTQDQKLQDLTWQCERLQRQLENSERERESFAGEIQRLGECALSDTREMEWQAREAAYDRQVRVPYMWASCMCLTVERNREGGKGERDPHTYPPGH